MAEYVSTVSAADMKGPVKRSSGSLGGDHNSTFVTSLMTALISDAKYQSKLDEYWAEAVALGDENYFNQSLKLLNGLLVSGNMPNLANPPSAPQSSSAGPESSPSESSSSVAPGPASSSSAPVQTESSSSMDVGPASSSSAANAIAAPALLPAESFSVHGRVLQLNLHADSRVAITSVTGVVVKSFRAGANSTSISLADLPSGTYLVRVQSAGAVRIRTFSIK